MSVGSPTNAQAAALKTVLAALGKSPAAHKYSHGHALVLSGGTGRGGAARLAALGALRVGAGLVTLGCPPGAIAENAAQLNAIMLRPVADAGDLDALLTDARLNALCLGPGLGQGPRTRDLVRVALDADRPVVLDADALSEFQGRPEDLFDQLHGKCVLTPHGGEFARLFPDIAATLDAAKPGSGAKSAATMAAARRAGCVVLLKGAQTTIAAPAGQTGHQDRPAPWLATAGSGDVLAGIITGLLARGQGPFDAAMAGVWLHVEAARSFGPGLIAEDIPQALPGVFKSLGL